MRPKKDPGIRQEIFINAASELFMEKGYEAVSVRNILDAVADKTASPSVFYYYFPSKDALYRACIEHLAHDYLSCMKTGFTAKNITLKEWMLSMVSAVDSYLLNERNLIMTGGSTVNRLFILDIREQVTDHIAHLWYESLSGIFKIPGCDCYSLSRFLAGGIGQMMFDFLSSGIHDKKEIYDFTEKMVLYTANTMHMPDEQISEMIKTLKDMHENS